MQTCDLSMKPDNGHPHDSQLQVAQIFTDCCIGASGDGAAPEGIPFDSDNRGLGTAGRPIDGVVSGLGAFFPEINPLPRPIYTRSVEEAGEKAVGKHE